ncbi:aldo/keto reductase [Spirochaetia bacterium]|nr:aldo/keto reductase [Spirochaetia bacterium]
MEKVRFGKTGLMVSKVALGGIPIMRISKTEAAKLVQETISLGINFIDTAHVYADSEEKIGEGIKGIPREDLVIATKSPANDKITFNENLDLSLKRLGVDYIDIYQLHNIGSEKRRDAIFAPGGAYEGLQEAVKAGKVRFPGFSSHSLVIAIDLMKSGKFASVQLPFNYIDHDAEKEAIPLAKKLDMGFIAMKPMGGGLLDKAELSFRYLLQYDHIVPDPGIERIEEIREIVGIVERKSALTESDKIEIEKMRTEFGPSWCHRCNYCQPCPQDIPISTALGAKSSMKRFSIERARSMIGPAIEKARNCLACGDCMTRCPYDLQIPELLKESIAYWDSAQLSK